MAQRQIIIRRAKPKETRIQNYIIWDKNMSHMARFSLIAMLSLPDNWDYSVRGMAVLLGLSKDTMSKYIKELETAKYLKRKQVHGENGRFSNTQYILTDTPGDFGDDTEDDLTSQSNAEPCPKKYDTDDSCHIFSAPVKSAPVKSPQKKRTEEKKRTEQKTTPTPPQEGRRPSKYDLAEDAKPLLRSYCGEDQELARALADLIEVRREKKAINSKRGIKALLAQLDDLSKGDRQSKLLLLRQSTANSWKSVFPLKGGGGPTPRAPDAPLMTPERFGWD